MVTSYRNAEDGFALLAIEQRAEDGDTEWLRAAVVFLANTLVLILDEPDLDRAHRRLRARMALAARGEVTE